MKTTSTHINPGALFSQCEYRRMSELFLRSGRNVGDHTLNLN